MRRLFVCVALAVTLAAWVKAEDVPVKTIETVACGSGPEPRTQHGVVSTLSACSYDLLSFRIIPARHWGQARDRNDRPIDGFFINRDGYFLTAAHVIQGLKSVCVNGNFAAIFIPTAPWGTREKLNKKWFSFSDCQTDAESDIAACKLTENPFTYKPLSAIIEPARLGTFAGHPDGRGVAFSGFPLASMVPITSKGYIATYFAIEDWFGVDKIGWGGASGSPVYDSRGVVIGMVLRRTFDEGSGLTFARPAERILTFLQAHKIRSEK